jgi:hypothetical protein
MNGSVKSIGSETNSKEKSRKRTKGPKAQTPAGNGSEDDSGTVGLIQMDQT